MPMSDALAAVEMPPAVAALPRDPRGYPIFFSIQKRNAEGEMTGYSFQSMEPARVVDCVQFRRCSVCGEKLGYWIVFCGGPLSCANRAFTDPPMHRECAEYAARVCPYILRGGFDRTRLARFAAMQERDPSAVEVQDLGKPASMNLYITRRFVVKLTGARENPVPLFHPSPATEIVPVGPGSEFALGLPITKRSILLSKPVVRERILPATQEMMETWFPAAGAAANPAPGYDPDPPALEEARMQAATWWASRLEKDVPKTYDEAVFLLASVWKQGRYVDNHDGTHSFVFTSTEELDG